MFKLLLVLTTAALVLGSTTRANACGCDCCGMAGMSNMGTMAPMAAPAPGEPTAVAQAPGARVYRSYSYEPSTGAAPAYRAPASSAPRSSSGMMSRGMGSRGSRTPLYMLPKGDPRKTGGR